MELNTNLVGSERKERINEGMVEELWNSNPTLKVGRV